MLKWIVIVGVERMSGNKNSALSLVGVWKSLDCLNIPKDRDGGDPHKRCSNNTVISFVIRVFINRILPLLSVISSLRLRKWLYGVKKIPALLWVANPPGLAKCRRNFKLMLLLIGLCRLFRGRNLWIPYLSWRGKQDPLKRWCNKMHVRVFRNLIRLQGALASATSSSRAMKRLCRPENICGFTVGDECYRTQYQYLKPITS